MPTLDVLVNRVPDPPPRLAAALNQKRGTVYCAVYESATDGDHWRQIVAPAVRTIDGLLAASPGPLTLVGPSLPQEAHERADLTVLPASLAQPRSDVVYRLGRRAAIRGQWTDPAQLAPHYRRPPQALPPRPHNQKHPGPWTPPRT